MIRATKRTYYDSNLRGSNADVSVDEEYISQEMKKIKLLPNSPGELRLDKDIASLPSSNCYSVLRTENKSVIELWCHMSYCLPSNTAVSVSFEFEITISKYYPHNCPQIVYKRITSESPFIAEILPSINHSIYLIFDQQSNLLINHKVIDNWSAINSILTVIESLVTHLKHI